MNTYESEAVNFFGLDGDCRQFCINCYRRRNQKLQPTFFELPDYTTEITNEQSNLFLNPEDSLSLFDPSKISIIGIGSADDVNYAFVSNSKKVSYVTSGEEMLPGVFIQNISPANNTVKLTYKGKVYSLSIDNPSIDR